MDTTPAQIRTIGATKLNEAITIASKPSYICANSQITKGLSDAPTDLADCYAKFPKIKEIGESLGLTAGGVYYGSGKATANVQPMDLLLNERSQECVEVNNPSSGLGSSWLGCLWGSPEAPFSCTCPEIGENFINYLKLRLNVATFWNTPIETPPRRREFLDSIRYGPKLDIVVGGDLLIKPGDLISVKADNISGYPYQASGSVLSYIYYVLTVKHTFTNGGVHETLLNVVEILRPQHEVEQEQATQNQ